MEFGLHLPASTAGIKSEDLIRFAQQAETLGFYCITVADHVIVPRDISVPYPYTTDGKYPGTGYHLETLMTMGFLAGATNRIRFVTSVMILPYRNPIVTAKMLASLDVLSGGRVIVGAGRRLDEGRIRNLAHRAVRGARQSHRRVYHGVSESCGRATIRASAANIAVFPTSSFFPSPCRSRRSRSGSAAIANKRSAVPRASATAGIPSAACRRFRWSQRMSPQICRCYANMPKKPGAIQKKSASR